MKLKDLKNPKIKEIKKKLKMGIRRKNIKEWNKTVKTYLVFVLFKRKMSRLKKRLSITNNYIDQPIKFVCSCDYSKGRQFHLKKNENISFFSFYLTELVYIFAKIITKCLTNISL